MADTFRLFVRGEPKPKGSLRAFVVKGRPIITNDSSKTRPWQHSIQAQVALSWEGPPWDGPVEATMVFQLLRPKGAKKRPWPHLKPDLDKLVRCVKDGLKGAGAVTDDARIVSLVVEKRYAEQPGVLIELRKLA